MNQVRLSAQNVTAGYQTQGWQGQIGPQSHGFSGIGHQAPVFNTGYAWGYPQQSVSPFGIPQSAFGPGTPSFGGQVYGPSIPQQQYEMERARTAQFATATAQPVMW